MPKKKHRKKWRQGKPKKYKLGKKPKKENKEKDMTLTADVTKAWPTFNPENGLFYIGVEVVLNDDDITNRHLDQDEQKSATFTVASHKGADPEDKAAELISKIQPWITSYVEEKNAHKHAKYTTMTSTVESGLDLTE